MKASLRRPYHSRKLLFGLFAFSAALVLLAVTSIRVFADSVEIVDNAHVLDVAAVTNEAYQLPYPVSVYTTKTFKGTTAAFDTYTNTFIGPNDSNLIFINIDVTHRHLAIVGGIQVPLSNDQYAAAIQAFKDNFNNGDYTGATVAALQSLNSALVPPPSDTGNNGYPSNGPIDTGQGQMTSDTNSGVDPVVSLLIFAGVIIVAVFIMRAGAKAVMRGSQTYSPRPHDATPFEAGAMGTMIGYELGREEREHEQIQHQMFNNNPPPINNFPGGNIGGGASGNFGGGMGGGNIGGGSSGNF